MLEPSYRQIMEKLNEDEEAQAVKSRYSIIIATARRARQLVDENDEETMQGRKPITVAIDELYTGKMKIREKKN
ncbi:MAG: DNA-directed RNA polymerase subunit omega [Epulopiscium sp.]|nr:DNA-directed RNA polymerase subunit omega [Candidatus Epulonipiscium sp.]